MHLRKMPLKYWGVPSGVVHANVGQKHINHNILLNLSNFKVSQTEICTLLLGDATHFSYESIKRSPLTYSSHASLKSFPPTPSGQFDI
jgi:hypothetical protein